MNSELQSPNVQQDLAAENAELRRRLAEYEARDQQAVKEGVITEKMAHGLSRERAIAVIQRQRQFDATKLGAKAAA